MQFSSIVISATLALSVAVHGDCCYPSQEVCYWNMCLGVESGFGTDECLVDCTNIICPNVPWSNPTDPTVEEVQIMAWNC
ncbi:hypothetical protein L207DRAFT_592431 [Hyaloscypha variabilis F]|uniref:Extracellular membrane protein CFEM domain-containing protein n=1 Tax=Hyaloscypha variabilis (strain UAMH 11265 / GT02V1 / F) TaxID=1149755 RepID=A0A2J6QWN6_HYAVF|nr:hypothetical protein L207DRAFT_592431 [Hyaloscypha variabilis F]